MFCKLTHIQSYNVVDPFVVINTYTLSKTHTSAKAADVAKLLLFYANRTFVRNKCDIIAVDFCLNLKFTDRDNRSHQVSFFSDTALDFQLADKWP